MERVITVIILLLIFVWLLNSVESANGIIGFFTEISNASLSAKYHYAKVILFLIAAWGLFRLMARNSRQGQRDDL